MAARKRKTLPRDLGEIIESGDLSAFAAVFDRCEIDARGGYGKEPALSYYGTTEQHLRWLVEHGADIEATDDDGATPLHAHAGSWRGLPGLLLDLGADLNARDHDGRTPLFSAVPHHPRHVRTLLARGADPVARDEDGETPLRHGLVVAENSGLVELVECAELLLAAGDEVDDGMRDRVRGIGARFEEYRDVYDPESVGEADAALRRLYELFAVEPARARRRHDGASPIEVPEGDWRSAYGELWETLVPGAGAAPTAQGEAIRVAGRVWYEIADTGGTNWDAEYRAMLDVLTALLADGRPLPQADLAEAGRIACGLRRGDGPEEDLERLVELAVDWVRLNPAPLPLPPVPYDR